MAAASTGLSGRFSLDRISSCCTMSTSRHSANLTSMEEPSNPSWESIDRVHDFSVQVPCLFTILELGSCSLDRLYFEDRLEIHEKFSPICVTLGIY